jgi:3-hydroxyacyl-CoA dehydrogenase
VGLHHVGAPGVWEVALPDAFDEALADRVLDLLTGAGHTAVPCGDAHGRIVDRLAVAVLLEARALRAARPAPGGVPDAVTAALDAGGLATDAIRADDVPTIAAALHEGSGGADRFDPDAPPPAGGVPVDPAALRDRLELVAIAEGYRVVGDAVAGVAEIEAAMTLGAGWRQGPFTLAGRRGLRDVVEGLTRACRAPGADAATLDRFRVPPLLWQLATA